MKNVFIAIAITAALSACSSVPTYNFVPANNEARFCNLSCAFHGVGVGTNGTNGTGTHGASATSGGMGHGTGASTGGRGTSGNGASSGAARR